MLERQHPSPPSPTAKQQALRILWEAAKRIKKQSDSSTVRIPFKEQKPQQVRVI